MPRKWTRAQIIHDIVQREAAGLSLSSNRRSGVESSLYQAGRRVFGSWRHALMAAGVAPERVLSKGKWPPARILTVIRNLSRRRQPLSKVQIQRRYGSLAAAARQVFGSWSGAVIAAGVQPTKFQRVVPWTRERVIEAILTRALKNDPLAARSTRPRSLVEAGQRFFGSWAAALEAAGLDGSRLNAAAPRIGPLPQSQSSEDLRPNHPA